jgi:glutathionylspermidine synthase
VRETMQCDFCMQKYSIRRSLWGTLRHSWRRRWKRQKMLFIPFVSEW